MWRRAERPPPVQLAGSIEPPGERSGANTHVMATDAIGLVAARNESALSVVAFIS